MSVVLAFGLSPIGQVKAYAETGKQPAQQEQALQTQDEVKNALSQKYEVNAYNVTFVNKPLFNNAVASSYLFNNGFITVTQNIPASTSTPASTKVLKEDGSKTEISANNDFTVVFKDANGDTTTKIQDAGTYTVYLKGKGDFARQETAPVTFQVLPYDISKVKFTNIAPKGFNYLGKAVPVAYTEGSEPSVTGVADPNDDPDAIAAKEKGLTNGDPGYVALTLPTVDYALGVSDFAFVPPTVVGPGTVDVTLKGVGNYTGEKATTVKVGTGELTKAGNASVNGAQNTEANAVAAADATSDGTNAATGDAVKYVSSIDLGKAKKNPKFDDPDPAGEGKVVFGETTLHKGTDYSVKYFTGASDKTGSADFPTEVASGYRAEITILNNNFVKTPAFAKITVNYSITVGSSLDEIAEKVEFGDAGYLGRSAADLSEQQMTTVQQSLLKPSSVKFTSEAGADVTSFIGDSYEIYSVEEWDADMEEEWLGEDAYSEKYPYEDSPYENTPDVASYFANLKDAKGQPATVKYADKFEINSTGAKYDLGFAGLPAGDYKLTVKAKTGGKITEGALSGKFTVAKATASEGTSAGQIKITPKSTGYNSGEAIDTTANKPKLEISNGIDTKGATDAVSWSAVILRQGTPKTVKQGLADYYVTYSQNGKEVVPAAAGTYDATFTFGGTNFAAGEITKAGALVVGKQELADVVKHVEVDPDSKYMYTGSGMAPDLLFYGEAVDDSDDSTAGQSGFEKAIDARDQAKTDLGTAKGNYDSAVKALAEAQAALDANDDDSKTATLEAAVATAAKELNGDPDGVDDEAKAGAKGLYVAAQAAYDAAKETLAEYEVPESKLGSDDYTVSYSSNSNDAEYSSDGKPLAIAPYIVTVKGAGRYVSSEGPDAPDPITTTFSIAKLDLSDEDFSVVQFSGDNGATWTENYSTVKGAQTEVKPQVRIVTAQTKDDASPVILAKGLYNDPEYADNKAEGRASVTLNYNTEMAGYYANGAEKRTRTAYFGIAYGSFADEGVEASIELTPATKEYTGSGHEVGIKVKTKAGAELVAETAAKAGNGQYVWSVKGPDGKEIAKSTDANAEAALKAGIKNVGKYTVTVNGSTEKLDYAGTLTATYEVTSKEVKANDSKLSIKFHGQKKGEFTYANGAELPAIVAGDVTYEGEGDFTEVESADKATGNNYVLTGAKYTDAGDYTATVELCGNYTGTRTVKYTVDPIDISATHKVAVDKDGDGNQDTDANSEDGLAWADEPMYNLLIDDSAVSATKDALAKGIYSVDYNGQAQKPTVVVEDYNGRVVKAIELTYLYADNTNASKHDAATDTYKTTASVTAIASGQNYTGRKTGYFAINGYDIASDRMTYTFSDDELKYNGGKPVEPKGTLTYTMKNGEKYTLQYGTDYMVEYSGDNVNVGGNAVAKFIGLEPNFVGGKETVKSVEFTVQAAPQDQEIAAGNLSLAYGATEKVTASAKTELTYVPDNSGVYSVDAAGNVKALKVGSGKLTIKAAATDEFKAAEKTITVKVTKAANAKFKVTAKKKVYAAKTTAKKAFKASALYKVTGKAGKVTYKKANTAGAKKIVVAKNGKITVKKGLKAGTYKVKVKATSAANKNYKAASKNVTIKVKVTKK